MVIENQNLIFQGEGEKFCKRPQTVKENFLHESINESSGFLWKQYQFSRAYLK